MTDRYTHNLPLNIPLFLIIISLVNLVPAFFVYKIHSNQSLWSSVIEAVDFSPELILFVFGVFGVNVIFMFLGFWLLLNKRKEKPS